MLRAFEAVLPMFATLGLGYAAAAHHRVEPDQVPTLNKIVLLYAVPMSIAVGVLRTPAATLDGEVRLMVVLGAALVGLYAVAFIAVRFVARRDTTTSALYALGIAFPAVPMLGPAILPALFGSQSNGLIVSVSLIGNVVLVPGTLVLISTSADASTPPSPRAAAVDGAVVSALKKPLVWVPALALLIVLCGVRMPLVIDQSLGLMGNSAGGLALFSAGIVLKSQRVSVRPGVVAAALARNVLAPLAVVGIVLACGLTAADAGEAGVAASLLAPPIIVTLAIEYGRAQQEMSSTLLLSALAAPFTNAVFIALASRPG